MVTDTPRLILLTGVSSGIGWGLANHYLADGATVYGLSRRRPEGLAHSDALHFQSVDLRDAGATHQALRDLLDGVDSLDLVVLNAGVLGQFGDLADADLDDLQQTMQVNVWANVILMQGLMRQLDVLKQVVAISSGASINGHRGWSGYSISKAALNMLMKLLARELPQTHVSALAPGLVDTAMQDDLCGRPSDPRFPAVDVLKSKRNTPEMPDPTQVAPRLAQAIAILPQRVESGEFIDVRRMEGWSENA